MLEDAVCLSSHRCPVRVIRYACLIALQPLGPAIGHCKVWRGRERGRTRLRGSILHPREIEPVRRRDLAAGGAVAGDERRGKIAGAPFALADMDQRAGWRPYARPNGSSTQSVRSADRRRCSPTCPSLRIRACVFDAVGLLFKHVESASIRPPP